MPIHHALLSLLNRGESYGYELKGDFERSVGPQWGTLNIGQIYQVLSRLERDGLVRVARSESQPRRPDRVIYAITPEGRTELQRWIAEPAGPPSGYRDELYLKLDSAARDGEHALRAAIERERRALLGELRALQATRHDEEFAALLADGAALHVRARLEWLDVAEQRAQALADAATQRERTATHVESNPVRRRRTADG